MFPDEAIHDFAKTNKSIETIDFGLRECKETRQWNHSIFKKLLNTFLSKKI